MNWDNNIKIVYPMYWLDLWIRNVDLCFISNDNNICWNFFSITPLIFFLIFFESLNLYQAFPITAALCTALIYTARTRQIQPRFYHYLGAAFFGFFAGKLSYRSVCEDKLIKSNSNSPFVQSIRKRKGLFFEGIYNGLH